MTQPQPKSKATDRPTDDFHRAEAHYDTVLRDELEKQHLGSYVMINVDTLQYVIDKTLSATHAQFIDKFGKEQRGWCTRIGASIFAIP